MKFWTGFVFGVLLWQPAMKVAEYVWQHAPNVIAFVEKIR
jgi:hypothetical protein